MLTAFLSTLAAASIPQANADNVIGSPSDITFAAGDSNNELKIKIVSNTAQSQKGDPVPDCNIGVKGDGITVDVTLTISPDNGLVATPNPVVFDECNKFKSVTLTSDVGGTYVITASAEDNDPRDGVYHLSPFGEVTVVVIDTTPPETTIDSDPANPTSNTSATFTFSSNEPGSTFECSLDGTEFASCESGVTYTGLAFTTHDFAVRATDQSGNTDQTPDTHQWEIRNPSITITAVNPESALWGVPVDVSGTADPVDLIGLTVTVDWGDGTTDQGIAISSGKWSAPSHTYAASGVITITANLTDGATVKASTTDTVTLNKHTTSLTLVMPDHVTGSTKFLASGYLTDTSINSGIPGATIEFSGDSAPDDVLTQGITFHGTLDFVSCDIPSECTDDPAPLNITGNADNVVLHLGVGGNITFPQSTGQAIVYLQDVTASSFKYKVIEYPDIAQDCNLLTPVVEEECTSLYDSAFINKIDTVSGYTTSGDYKLYNGIKAIIITEVGGSTTSGSIGVSAIITRSVDTDPTDQHVINFETQELPSSPSSPFTVNAGAYHAIGVAQADAAADLTMHAEFDGDMLYMPSDSGDPETYGVERNTNGFGATFIPSGSGTSVTEYACAGLSDSDNDGICDEFELTGEIFIEGVSPTIAWNFPAGEEPTLGLPDVYYEIDCMNGFCPPAAEIAYIEGRFAAQGIRMHLMIDQTNLTVCNPLKVWSDADANECNDFRSIKLNNYGTGTERASGDLGSGNPLLTLKSQAVRYLLFAKNINTVGGGPTGIAEFKGNDAIVAIDSLPVAAADKDETRIGTIMHEIGHNLGLLHGGTDDVNCKPNYISVMNYNRQVPHSKMPVPSASAATGVGWYGDYSHGNLQLRTSGGALIGDGLTLNENDLDDGNKLTKSGTWRAFDGSTSISSFRILWGTPTLNTPVQYTNTGAQIDWDKDVETANDSNQKFDTNFLSVTVGGTQLPACTEAPLFSMIQAGGNDYVTMKANIAKFNGASSAFLGLTPAIDGDPNAIPEVDVEIHAAFDSEAYQFLGVENPLNNVAFGEPGIATSKKGNTIHVRFNLNDASGTPITGDNISSYPELVQGQPFVLRVAKVTGIDPPSDEEYFAPDTSTQGQNADFFTWDGSKWSIQWGTKSSLTPLGTYAARIYAVQTTGEGVVLDQNGDGISFLVQLVKN